MKPATLAFTIAAAWMIAGIGAAAVFHRATRTTDADRADEDAAQAEWLRLLDTPGRVARLCAGCSIGIYADQLDDHDLCAECAYEAALPEFRDAVDRLFHDDGTL